MTKAEFDIIRAAIKSAYPSHNIMPDIPSIRLWYRLLEDIPYEVCEHALYELITTKTFPPSIAEIRKACMEYQMPQVPDSSEAWGLVTKAIPVYGIHRADEAVASLPEPVRTAVTRIGFREICMDENVEASQAHFIKLYEAIEKKALQESQMPAFIGTQKEKYKALIDLATPKLAPPSVDKKPVEKPSSSSHSHLIDQLRKQFGMV